MMGGAAWNGLDGDFATNLEWKDLLIPGGISLLSLFVSLGTGIVGANYNDSVLLNGIGILREKLNDKTFKRPIYGAFDAFMLNREFAIPEINELRVAEKRAVEVNYLKRSVRNIKNSRTCDPTAVYGDSGTINPTWKIYSQTVKTSQKIFANNEFSAQQAFANDMKNAFIDLYTDIEGDAVGILESNKTGVNVGTLGTFDAVNDIMNIAAVDEENYYNYISTTMVDNDYNGNLVDVHTINMIALQREQMAQGDSNDRNDRFQFEGFDHLSSKQITNGSDLFGTNYIFEDNAVAVIDWIPGMNRRGFENKEGIWTTMDDPFGYPFQWSVFRKEICSDTTADGGNTQDAVTIWEISLDLSFNVAPIDVATETPIFKFGLLK